MRVLVLGGLGFIGKHFVRSALARGEQVTVVDALTYAADRGVEFPFLMGDIAEMVELPAHDVVVNLAAQSHVGRSVEDIAPFVRSNVMGVQRVLELSPKLLVHVSSDEVYGAIPAGRVDEDAPLKPSNPYACTKASGDVMIAGSRARWRILRPSNNYGAGQHPEKLIPRCVQRIERGQPAEVHGDGQQERMWLHVEDTVAALWTVIERGEDGGVYNAAGEPRRNLEIVRAVCEAMGGQYRHVPDRAAQDRRYATDDSRLRGLGWAPRRAFGLEDIIEGDPWREAA